jgi:hypothetical protein
LVDGATVNPVVGAIVNPVDGAIVNPVVGASGAVEPTLKAGVTDS